MGRRPRDQSPGSATGPIRRRVRSAQRANSAGRDHSTSRPARRQRGRSPCPAPQRSCGHVTTSPAVARAEYGHECCPNLRPLQPPCNRTGRRSTQHPDRHSAPDREELPCPSPVTRRMSAPLRVRRRDAERAPPGPSPRRERRALGSGGQPPTAAASTGAMTYGETNNGGGTSTTLIRLPKQTDHRLPRTPGSGVRLMPDRQGPAPATQSMPQPSARSSHRSTLSPAASW